MELPDRLLSQLRRCAGLGEALKLEVEGKVLQISET
jgi:hypothetical protein